MREGAGDIAPKYSSAEKQTFDQRALFESLRLSRCARRSPGSIRTNQQTKGHLIGSSQSCARQVCWWSDGVPIQTRWDWGIQSTACLIVDRSGQSRSRTTQFGIPCDATQTQTDVGPDRHFQVWCHIIYIIPHASDKPLKDQSSAHQSHHVNAPNSFP